MMCGYYCARVLHGTELCTPCALSSWMAQHGTLATTSRHALHSVVASPPLSFNPPAVHRAYRPLGHDHHRRCPLRF